METIQLTIEESLLAEAEQTARSLDMSRSDFIKEALERALRQREIIVWSENTRRVMHATHRLPIKLVSGKVSKSGENRETR
ncbi:hypothetical protein BH20ACI3_BH20ACI3_25350 [soil metagenome]